MRALEHGCRLGPHGLPLMGTGDWNDGMNQVGADGKGESVWTAGSCVDRPEGVRGPGRRSAATPRARPGAGSGPSALRAALEEHAWDGDWYRRAYFDDGTPLGSAQNDECRIDSLAADLGGDLRRRRPGAGAAGHGRGRTSAWCAPTAS